MKPRKDWGVWCTPVGPGKSLWYQSVPGVREAMTEAEARELAAKVNREGVYRARALPLKQEHECNDATCEQCRSGEPCH